MFALRFLFTSCFGVTSLFRLSEYCGRLFGLCGIKNGDLINSLSVNVWLRFWTPASWQASPKYKVNTMWPSVREISTNIWFSFWQTSFFWFVVSSIWQAVCWWHGKKNLWRINTKGRTSFSLGRLFQNYRLQPKPWHWSALRWCFPFSCLLRHRHWLDGYSFYVWCAD